MRPNLTYHDFFPKLENLKDAILAGLKHPEKRIASKFLYDKRGSELFHQICQQPEYYQTETETGILERNADEISRLAGERCLLVEYGSGNSKKIRTLLSHLSRESTYMPVDISRNYLLEMAEELATDYPHLEIAAVCADFLKPFSLPQFRRSVARRLLFFPGSTIGNFEPATALGILKNAAALVGPSGGLLIGVDLKKDPAILNAAYNDAKGITAIFELNILVRLNRELGSNFVVEEFEYLGFYSEAMSRVEMYVVSKREQRVTIAGETILFKKGERVHVENSYKFSVEEFHHFAAAAELKSKSTWVDEKNLFSVHFLEVPA